MATGHPGCGFWTNLRWRYNLERTDYERMFRRQKGLCSICRINPATHVDHDHTCCPEKARSCGKCIRGLICDKCNRMLGWAKDNAVTLRRAAKYLLNFSNLTDGD
jgi:hypothetical protein